MGLWLITLSVLISHLDSLTAFLFCWMNLHSEVMTVFIISSVLQGAFLEFRCWVKILKFGYLLGYCSFFLPRFYKFIFWQCLFRSGSLIPLPLVHWRSDSFLNLLTINCSSCFFLWLVHILLQHDLLLNPQGPRYSYRTFCSKLQLSVGVSTWFFCTFEKL